MIALHAEHLCIAARAQWVEEDEIVDDVTVLDPASPDGCGMLQLLPLRQLRLLAGDVRRVLYGQLQHMIKIAGRGRRGGEGAGRRLALRPIVDINSMHTNDMLHAVASQKHAQNKLQCRRCSSIHPSVNRGTHLVAALGSRGQRARGPRSCPTTLRQRYHGRYSSGNTRAPSVL